MRPIWSVVVYGMSNTQQVRRKKITHGFYKKPTKIQYFAWLQLPEASFVELDAQRFQLGQATLISWIIEEVYRNEDLRRVIHTRINEREDLPLMQNEAAKYRLEQEREANKQAYELCPYCEHRISPGYVETHQLTCKKKPKIPALPQRVIMPRQRQNSGLQERMT